MPGRSVVKILFEADDKASPAINKLDDNLGGLGGTATSVGKLALGGALVGGAAAAGAAVADLTNNYIQNVKQLRLMSQTTGVGVEDLSALQYAFEQTGFDADDLESVLFEVGVKLGDLNDGVPGVTAAFNQLNLTAADLARLNPADQLQLILERAQAIQNVGQRGFVLDSIFGGDDARKVAAIAENIGELTDEAERLGVTITDDSAAAAKEFETNMRLIEGAVQGAGQTVAMSVVNILGPAIGEFANALGLVPVDVDKTLTDVSTVIKDKSGEIKFQAGQVGAEAGLNLVQRFIRQVETSLANWNFQDALPPELRGYGGEVGEGVDTDFLRRSGLFTQSLDGPVPRRGAQAIGAGVDDVTRGLISGWISATEEEIQERQRQAEQRASYSNSPSRTDAELEAEIERNRIIQAQRNAQARRAQERLDRINRERPDDNTDYTGDSTSDGRGVGTGGSGGGGGRGGGRTYEISANFYFQGDTLASPDDIEEQITEAIQTNRIPILEIIEQAGDSDCA